MAALALNFMYYNFAHPSDLTRVARDGRRGNWKTVER
jgi:hypothetical protein